MSHKRKFVDNKVIVLIKKCSVVIQNKLSPNSCGRFLVAFADSFGCVDSLQAEARALLLGLQLGRQVGVSRLIVESDCLVLINCLRREWGVSAGIRPIVRAIRLDEPSSH